MRNAQELRDLGFAVWTDRIEQARMAGGQYDVVIANQVLEHVFEPNARLDGVYRILKPGGILFIGVPCFLSPIPLLLKRSNWYALVPDEHVWQFCERTLSRLLCSRGFVPRWYARGCSGFWGDLKPTPRSLARTLVYRSVSIARKGDFMSAIVERPLGHASSARRR